jgi:uncharacterized membrane protein
MKNILITICITLFVSFAYSQNLTREQMNEIATHQLHELITHFEQNSLILTDEQRTKIMEINLIVQDKVNSIKQHPGDVLSETDIQNAIKYRNQFRIDRTIKLLDPNQILIYNQFYPNSQFNKLNFQF